MDYPSECVLKKTKMVLSAKKVWDTISWSSHGIIWPLPISLSLQTWKNDFMEKEAEKNAYFSEFKKSYFLKA